MTFHEAREAAIETMQSCVKHNFDCGAMFDATIGNSYLETESNRIRAAHFRLWARSDEDAIETIRQVQSLKELKDAFPRWRARNADYRKRHLCGAGAYHSALCLLTVNIYKGLGICAIEGP